MRTANSPTQRLIVGIGALSGLLIVGTTGFVLLEELSLVDSLFMTVITISTVGFGEVRPLSPAGRLFTIGLIMGGAGIAAYSLSIAADFFFSGAWRAQWEHRRRSLMLSKLNQHVIICGYGRVGRHVAEELIAEKLPFVVIESNAEKVAHLQEAGKLALHGNAANENVLKEAGIERARGLVAAVNSDAENVFITLTARGMRDDLRIIARANYEESESKLMRAGASRVILPYRTSGRRMVTLMVRPEVADFLDEVAHASDLELLIDQVAIAPGSPIIGQSLRAIRARLQDQSGATLLACRVPNGPVTTQMKEQETAIADMHIIALGTREQLRALQALARPS
jgi:voltage-gated potassium channel